MTQPDLPITSQTHSIRYWTDANTSVELSQGQVIPSAHSPDYAILELIRAEQPTQYLAIRLYSVVEQQEEFHYTGAVTVDLSVHSHHSEEDTRCYRFTEIRSFISAQDADQRLKAKLDRATKYLIDQEVSTLIGHLRSLDDAQAYTTAIVERITHNLKAD